MKCVICYSPNIEQKIVNEEIWVGDDVALIPLNVLVCNNCGERYYDRKAMRQLEEAEKAFRKSIGLDKNDKMTWFNLGNSLKWQFKYSEAEKSYKKALELDSEYSSALINLSEVLEAQKKFDEAINTLKKVPDSDPKYIVVDWNLKGIIERKKEYKKILDKERELLDKININKLDKNSWYEIISFYIENGMFNQAELKAKKAIKYFKKNDGFYNLLGISLFYQRKFKESDTVFKKSIIKDFRSYYIWGGVLLELKSYKEAHKNFIKALMLNKTVKEVWHDIGLNLFNQGKFKKALKVFLKAIEIDQNFAKAHCAIGTCYYKLNNIENAEKEFKIALEIDKEYILASANLAELYFEQKKYKIAEEYFKKAFGYYEDIDNTYVKCLENLGKTIEVKEQKEKIKCIIYKKHNLF